MSECWSENPVRRRGKKRGVRVALCKDTKEDKTKGKYVWESKNIRLKKKEEQVNKTEYGQQKNLKPNISWLILQKILQEVYKLVPHNNLRVV